MTGVGERVIAKTAEVEAVRRLPDGFLAPPFRPGRPHVQLPAGATDCHAHVFGPFHRFPLAPERHYTPPSLPGPRYLETLDAVGLSRGVLVQGGAHGTDCRAMLDALDRGAGRLRGIASIAPDVADATLADMDRRGVRGIRFSRPPEGLTKGAIGFDAFAPLAPRIAALGWHAQVQTTCRHLLQLAPELLSAGVPIVVDHMGLVDPRDGVDDAAFHGLLKLLETGQIWVKLTAYRLSARFPDYGDMRPFHQALVSARSDRLLWGSDWPHVHMIADMPDFGHLLDLLAYWTGDADLFSRILVDNPGELYGFPPA